MFDLIGRFLKDLTGGDDAAGRPVDDPRIAAAALMVAVMSVDGTVGEVERQALKRILATHYDLTAAAAADLARSALAADREAVDFYAFTTLLKRRVDLAGRMSIVEMLWEMVLADGRLHEFEDNVVWRIAELLDIDTHERVALRKKVEARLGRPVGDHQTD